MRTDRRELVGGLLHERSGSGQTIFVEPLAVVEDNNALAEAVEEEREEVHRILVALTARFSSRREDLVAAVEVLTELDAYQARAEFSSRVAGVFPDFSDRLVLRGARHPLLDRRLADLRADVFGELEERHADAVPLDLELPEGSRLLLLSGPNAGGKSVAMKTVGLFALLAQSGFAIPAAAGSTLPVFDKVLVVAGDAQDLLGDLSSFAAAMTRTARVLAEATPRSLVLVDELGSGTDPDEGAALAIAVLEEDLARGGVTVATTHLSVVKEWAQDRPGVLSAAMEFDEKAGRPTFRVRPGASGRSRALAVAEKAGLPARVLSAAKKRLGAKWEAADAALARLETETRRAREEADKAKRAAEEAGARLVGPREGARPARRRTGAREGKSEGADRPGARDAAREDPAGARAHARRPEGGPLDLEGRAHDRHAVGARGRALSLRRGRGASPRGRARGRRHGGPRREPRHVRPASRARRGPGRGRSRGEGQAPEGGGRLPVPGPGRPCGSGPDRRPRVEPGGDSPAAAFRSRRHGRRSCSSDSASTKPCPSSRRRSTTRFSPARRRCASFTATARGASRRPCASSSKPIPGSRRIAGATRRKAARRSRSRGWMSEPVYDITDDVKRDVLAATDLVQLVGTTTSLKKAGRSWKGLCPFHGEKTPSFHVHPDKGFYYCFGCGAKGDAITFVRETERLEFPEAVAYLARLAGITLPMRRSGTRVDRGKETRAAEALALAAAFFRANLDRHEAARALLEKRGLSLEDARAYGLGAALDAWDALKTSLAARVQEDTALDAGLLQKNPETGRVYDRFRNRLTIEIRDGRGEILGFGARAFGDEQPKYLNSPETARFSKGKLLYGLDRAKEAIRREDAVLLVEGYFDRIACERAGAPNAVASMGTALTPAQAELLARHARDGDRCVRRRRARRRRGVQGVSAAPLARGLNVQAPRFAGRARSRLVPLRTRSRRAARGDRREVRRSSRRSSRGSRRAARSDPTERAAKLRRPSTSSRRPGSGPPPRAVSRGSRGAAGVPFPSSPRRGRKPLSRRLSRLRRPREAGLPWSCRRGRRVCSRHFSPNGPRARL